VCGLDSSGSGQGSRLDFVNLINLLVPYNAGHLFAIVATVKLFKRDSVSYN